jgi:DNA repair protein RadA/Sms
LVRGSLTLLSGEPGIGKSTLTLQLAQWCASEKTPVLYVSGENERTIAGELTVSVFQPKSLLFSRGNTEDIIATPICPTSYCDWQSVFLSESHAVQWCMAQIRSIARRLCIL